MFYSMFAYCCNITISDPGIEGSYALTTRKSEEGKLAAGVELRITV